LARSKSSGALSTEAMIYVVLISILASAAVPALQGLSARARNARLSASISQVQTACDAFYVSTGEIAGQNKDKPYSVVRFESLVPAYLRFRPSFDAKDYGIGIGSVFFGITAGGRVFVTMTPPDAQASWQSISGVAYGSSGLLQLESSAEAYVPPTVTEIQLFASTDSADVGGYITVMARALDENGMGVSGVGLKFTLTGSLTGQIQLTCITDGQGYATLPVSSSSAEIVLIQVVLAAPG